MCCCLYMALTMCFFEVGSGYARRLERAKTNARRVRAGLPPLYTVRERWGIWKTATFNYYIGRHLCPGRVYGYDSHHVNWCMRTGTLGNEIRKSLKYFIHGCLYATLCFFLLTFHLHYSVHTSFFVTVVMAFIFGIGMAFSTALRCVVYLTLPMLFSSTGRSVLLSYVFVLVLTHPIANFSQNMEVMTQTITCGHQMAVNSTKDLVKAAAGPVVDILDDLRAVLDAAKVYAQKIQDAFNRVKNMFMEVGDSIAACKEWLKEHATSCQELMGKPYKKCEDTIMAAAAKCREYVADWLCNVVEWALKLCEPFRSLGYICDVPGDVIHMIGEEVTKPVNEAISKFSETFYFSVDIDYHYNVTLVASQTAGKIMANVKEGVRKRMEPFDIFRKWTNFWTTMMLLLLIYKAHKYRKRFLTRDGFDNFYITDELEDIDQVRRALMKDRVYPIPKREYLKYANPDCPILTIHELQKVGFGIVFFLGTALQATFFMSLDYLLYSLLFMIEKHGHIDIDPSVPSHSMLHVQGSGILADIYRAIITQFDPMKRPVSFAIDTTRCLPHPTEPNWRIYKTIGLVLLFCFISILLQPFFARCRHRIAQKHYPGRVRVRALWLYNNILMRRGNIMFFVRRNVRQLFKKKEADDANDLLAALGARSTFIAKLIRLAGVRYKYCVACGTSGKEDDLERFRHCPSLACNAVYCLRCFVQLGNVCSVCLDPCEYGDLAELDQERDSSDEEGSKCSIPTIIRHRLEYEKGSLGSTTDENISVKSGKNSYQQDSLYGNPYEHNINLNNPHTSNSGFNSCSATGDNLLQPARPFVELVTYEIFEMVDDLKEVLRKKSDTREHTSNSEEVSLLGFMEEEEEDPHEQSIHRQ